LEKHADPRDERLKSVRRQQAEWKISTAHD